MHFQCIVLCCFSTLYDEIVDVFHCGDFPLSRKLGEILKLVLVGQRELIICSWIWSSVHQILLLWLQTKLISHHLSNLGCPVNLLTSVDADSDVGEAIGKAAVVVCALGVTIG